MTHILLQFGRAAPGVTYADRPAAFGVAVRDGLIACVRVERGEGSYFDLPGGAVDAGENEREALAREFVEETGLMVVPGDELIRAAQFLRKTDGQAVNNRGGVYAVRIEAHDPAAKVEEDHQLVWLSPDEALRSLRHEAHAWAVTAWLRRKGR